MPSEPVPLVGVTGGIGSGKSEACLCFRRLGRTVMSADLIARDLTEKNAGVRGAISRAFGDGIYAPGGELRRSELARIVFREPAKLRALNAIVHPLVFSTLNDSLLRLRDEETRPYVVVEAALVFESGMDRNLDATVVVRAPEETRIERVIRRDRLPRQEIIARMRSQMPAEEASRRADFVIENNGAESDLMERVKFIDRVLTHMFAARTPRSRRAAR
ncbi:MAG TPA: dephospho-CoA kinase [Bacteroidota bacterium]|nr:dephospho-CoA kinase [Bacteroidota bacterium]